MGFFPFKQFLLSLPPEPLLRVSILSALWTEFYCSVLFVLFATSKSHYSECCAELFMSRVGIVTTEHITGTAEPELWSPGTTVGFGCQSPPAPWKPQPGLRSDSVFQLLPEESLSAQ